MLLAPRWRELDEGTGSELDPTPGAGSFLSPTDLDRMGWVSAGGRGGLPRGPADRGPRPPGRFSTDGKALQVPADPGWHARPGGPHRRRDLRLASADHE